MLAPMEADEFPVAAWRRPVDGRSLVSLAMVGLACGPVATGLAAAAGVPVRFAIALGVAATLSFVALPIYFDHRLRPAGVLRLESGRLFFSACPGRPVDLPLADVRRLAVQPGVIVLFFRGAPRLGIHAPRVRSLDEVHAALRRHLAAAGLLERAEASARTLATAQRRLALAHHWLGLLYVALALVGLVVWLATR